MNMDMRVTTNLISDVQVICLSFQEMSYFQLKNRCLVFKELLVLSVYHFNTFVALMD
jgi:hypothetical protein